MSFTDNLKDNQMKMAQNALLQTIFQDPNQALGDIYDALEDDADNEFIFEMFRKMTVGQLVVAGATFADIEHEKQARTPPAPVASGKSKPEPAKKTQEDDEEDDDEFEDEDDVDFEDDEEDDDEEEEDDDEDEFDDEEEEDDEEEDEDDEEEQEEEKPKARKSKKQKTPKSSKGKDKVEALDLSTPEAQKTYQGTIVKCLKKNKSRKKKSGMSAQNIRKDVGGTPKQVRDHLNTLIEEGRVAYGGQARGTRYWLE